MPAAAPVLDRRTLNRTLLERQGLLRRAKRPVAEVVEHLVGMQAQEPQNPFVALWCRLDPFDPAEQDRLMLDRLVVRTSLMRTTIHLVTADDALALRPLFAPVLARTLMSQRTFRLGLEGLDIDEIARLAASHLSSEPMSAGQLRPLLAERWPDRDPAVLMMAVRYLLPLVQVPPRGLWRQSRRPMLVTSEAWLGRPPADDGDVEALVLRYLRAFGPASVADVRTWSGLTNLAPAIARLRPKLRAFTDESGRELLDVPDAPIADAGLPAPPRFLPEYDNVFLSHADRSRIAILRLELERYARGTLLVDGFISAGWRVDRDRDQAVLGIYPFRELSQAEMDEIEPEAERLLQFAEPDAARRVVSVHAPGPG